MRAFGLTRQVFEHAVYDITAGEGVEVGNTAAGPALEDKDVALRSECGRQIGGCERVAFGGREIGDRAVTFGGWLVRVERVAVAPPLRTGVAEEGAHGFEFSGHGIGGEPARAEEPLECLDVGRRGGTDVDRWRCG